MTTARVPEPTLLITRITITAGPGPRYRTAKVRDPATKETYSHSLGKVGEPIQRYLGHRVSHSIHARLGDPGYYIALPPDLRSVKVSEVTYDDWNRRHSRELGWRSVGAPDLPSIPRYQIVGAPGGWLRTEGTVPPKPASNSPSAVEDFRTFLAEQVISSEHARCSAKALYVAYLRWCETNGSQPASQTRVGMWLAQQGYTRIKHGTITWLGLTPRELGN